MIIFTAAIMFLLMVDPAHADPVSAAIAAITKIAAWKIGTFAVGQFILRTAVSMALSALARAGMSKKQKGQGGGLRSEKTLAGEGTSGSFILGKYATGGTMVAPPMTDDDHGNTKNAFLTYVIDLGDIPIASLDGVWVGDEKLTLHPAPMETSTGHGWTGDFMDRAKFASHHTLFQRASGKFETLVWVKFYDGTQTTADINLLQTDGNGRPWTDDMVGVGIPYVIMHFRYKREVFQGLPECLFEVTGIRLYDPRRDSSVGGSGPQRWDDQSTHEPSENPAVQVYNILRGIRLPDGTVWGGAADAEDLPLANWFAAMNHADEQVDGQPRYRSSYEVKIGPEDLGGDTAMDVIEEILRGCSGAMSEFGGVWKIRLGGPGLPVMVLSDDDIVITESQQFRPFRGMQEAYNGVSAQYPEPAEMWASKEAPPRNNPTFLQLDDGRAHIASISLPACPYREQVQRVMRAYLWDSRRDRIHDLTLPPDFGRLEPLDCVAWTSLMNGYASKVFEITTRNDDLRTLLQQTGLREKDSSDYVWRPEDGLPSTVTNPTTVTPPAREVSDFAVAPYVILDDAGNPRRVAIRMTWNDGLDDARGLTYRIRRVGATEDAARGSVRRMELGEHIHSEGILPQTNYEVSARLDMNRATVWTGWLPVRTGIAGMTEEDLGPAIRDTIAAAEAAATAARTEVQEAIARADEAVAAAEAALALARDEADVDVQEAIAAADAALASSQAAQLAAGAANTALDQAQQAAAAALAEADRSSEERIASQAGRTGAEAARDAAVVARDTAQGSVSAAAENALLATTAAYNAALAAAQPTSVIAPTPLPGNEAYGFDYAGTVPGFVGAPASAYMQDAEAGPFIRRTSNGATLLRALAPAGSLTVLRVTARVRVSATMNLRLVAAWIGSNGATLLTGGYVTRAVTVADGIVEFTMVLGRISGGLVTQAAGGANWTSAIGMRFGVATSPSVAGQTFDVLGIKVEDLSAADAAARQASAASNSAAASLASANLSTSNADAAGSSAAASQASRLAAEAARDTADGARANAEIARDAAVVARQTAEEAASTAQESSELAVGSANTAGEAATSAVASAAAAASRVTDATRESSAAEQSRLSARLGAAQSFPPAIADGQLWTHSQAGDPAVVAAWPASASQGSVASGIATILGSVSGNVHIQSRGVLPWIVGRHIRVTAEVRVSAATPSRVRLLITAIRADYTSAGSLGTVQSLTPTVAGEWQTLVQDYELGNPPNDATQFRAGLFAAGNSNTPASTVEVRSILIEDITAQTLADRSRADAEIARAAAVVAKDDAESAMSAASESRRLAAEAQRLAEEGSDAASRSADAASESESRAAGFVDDAGAQALAAERSVLSAEVSRSQGPILPSDFEGGLGAWTTRRAGAPSIAPQHTNLTLGEGDGDFGNFGLWQPTAVAGNNVLTRGVVSARDRSYRITIDFKVMSVSGGTTVSLTMALLFLDAAYSEALSSIFAGSYAVGKHTMSGVISGTAGDAVDSVQTLLRSAGNTRLFMRAGLRLNENRAAVIRIGGIRIDDVTQELGAMAQVALAGVARDSAVSAKDDAEDAAASAQDSLRLTAEVSGRDMSVINDTFLTRPEWSRWGGQGTLLLSASPIHPVGRSWRFTVTSSQNDGLSIINSPDAIWTGQLDAEAYAVEVEYTLVSGSIAGSGVQVSWTADASGRSGHVAMALSEMASGASGQSSRTRFARGVIRKPSGFVGPFVANSLFVFANYQIWPRAAKTIIFHRVRIRPATAEELGGGEVAAGIRSNILVDYLTSAQTTAAVAALREELETTMGGSFAAVRRSATAIANLSGSVARIRNIATVDGEPVGAGIEAVAFNNTGGTSGTLLKLIGDNVVARGTLSADRLVVGLGKNLITDPGFLDGTRHNTFSTGHDAIYRVRRPEESYSHPGFPTLMMQQQNADSAGLSIVYFRPHGASGNEPGTPVSEGEVFTGSAYLSSHRCLCQVGIQFLDENGAQTGLVLSTPTNVGSGPSNNPDRWPRVWAQAVAPAGTRYARFLVRKHGTLAGSTDSFVFIWKPQLEESAALGQRPSPWSSDGSTYINGDRLITGTFDATRMITTPHIRAIMGRFVSLEAAGLTVANAEIDTLQLAGQSVMVSASQTLGDRRDGNNQWQQVNLIGYTLPQAAAVTITWFGIHGYNTLARQAYGFRLLINGNEIGRIGDAGTSRIETDTISFAWKRTLSAGTHNIQIQWLGANGSIQLYGRTLIIDGAMR
jgi:hypothetical protein